MNRRLGMKTGSKVLCIGLTAVMGAVMVGCSAGKDTGQSDGNGSDAEFTQTTI